MKTLLSQEKTQMDSIHFGQNGDCSNSTHVENLLPPDCVSPQIPSDSYDAVDKFVEPEISPRIGDEYQVELPPLIESHSRKRAKSETKARSDQNFLVGLPIMLTWINTLKSYVPGSQSRSRTSSDTNNKSIKTQTVEELHNLPTAEKISKCGGRGYILVPGLVDVCWNALEKDSFILGLYIFEKNFVEVRRFVGTKEMGAILPFYYGSFYGSREYHRWSECRKTKGKKGIFGQRIFSGARQHELLSRILGGVSEECRNAILEVSKTFGDDKMTLADYVFSLKTMVGIKILIDAVGIGKGKLDLTEMPLESSRSNPTRPEIPTGKALSSLTTDEIIKILSGDYRLSKARANDIFWEAVWPRLLARGWHSEQPNKQGYVRNCLVFLTPGIKKFSRRKLLRGEHYFDSLTDVLSKVAKEPELINLDSQEEGGYSGKKDEYESPPVEKKSEKHCYLQPRTPNRNTGVMKFTVVDTSLSGGKIRELRNFPSEVPNAFADQGHSEDSDEDTSEEKFDESNGIDTAMLDPSVTIDLSQKTAKKPSKKITHSVFPDISAALVPDSKNKKDSGENNRTKKVPKSRKVKRDNADYVGPVAKRCRTLTACSREETNGSPSGVNEVTENLSSQVGPSRDKTLTAASSSRAGPGKNVENDRRKMLIDLNLPQAPPELETSEHGIGQGSASNGVDNNSLPSSSANEALPEPPPLNLNPRRLSTRNRPPTMRALEAVADGYLTVSRKRKGKGASSNEKPAKLEDGVVGPSEPANDPAAPQIGEGENGVSNSGNSNMVVESQGPPEANEDSVSGQ